MVLFLHSLKLSGGKRQDVRSGDVRNLPTPERVKPPSNSHIFFSCSLSFFLIVTSFSFLMNKNLYGGGWAFWDIIGKDIDKKNVS